MQDSCTESFSRSSAEGYVRILWFCNGKKGDVSSSLRRKRRRVEMIHTDSKISFRDWSEKQVKNRIGEGGSRRKKAGWTGVMYGCDQLCRCANSLRYLSSSVWCLQAGEYLTFHFSIFSNSIILMSRSSGALEQHADS